jgi:ectoine hydroxylase-related dioxygenase (phytanoyl-CoA dioxygenase family)
MNIETEQPNANQMVSALERQGYCVLPHALSPDRLKAIRDELSAIEATVSLDPDSRGASVKMSDTRFLLHNLQFEACPTVHELIRNGVGKALCSRATGDELVCIGATYAHAKPGNVGIPLHTDFDPYGTDMYRPSNPVSVRVLHYLDDLTLEKAPLKLLPFSHVSLRKELSPDKRFEQGVVEGEVTFECPAGTAVMFNPRMFHGVGPNLTNEGRRVLAITYRPRWAKPLARVEEHSEIDLSKISLDLRGYFQGLND